MVKRQRRGTKGAAFSIAQKNGTGDLGDGAARQKTGQAEQEIPEHRHQDTAAETDGAHFDDDTNKTEPVEAR
jgi:hypothetical protein